MHWGESKGIKNIELISFVATQTHTCLTESTRVYGPREVAIESVDRELTLCNGCYLDTVDLGIAGWIDNLADSKLDV